MRWASALSKQAVAETALQEVIADVREKLATAPDLAVLFISAQHAHAAHALIAQLRVAWPSCEIVGCAGTGVIGAGEEIEDDVAITALAATLPGVDIEPLRVTEQPERGDAQAWRRAVGLSRDDVRAFIVLPSPTDYDPETLVAGLDLAYPDVVKVGGIASGFDVSGIAPLMLGGQAYRDGMVGLALCGNLEVDTLVAQGCRPVGQPMIITSCRDNIIYNFDRGKPDQMIRELYANMNARDRVLFQDSMFAGIEMTNKAGEYTQGDFLIRTVLGVDPERGAMAVGSEVHPFQVVQFQLRDKDTSAQDLRARLMEYRKRRPDPPAAALVFECVGRGRSLYGKPHHDTRLLDSALGHVPAAGAFCGGEIGPVGGRTFVHGYTVSVALFRPRDQ